MLNFLRQKLKRSSKLGPSNSIIKILWSPSLPHHFMLGIPTKLKGKKTYKKASLIINKYALSSESFKNHFDEIKTLKNNSEFKPLIVLIIPPTKLALTSSLHHFIIFSFQHKLRVSSFCTLQFDSHLLARHSVCS